MAHLLENKLDIDTSKSLVAIRPEGNRTPVYIIHGTDIDLHNFSGLVANIDPDQPVYGLQAKGLDGTSEPFDKMEDIAAHYISEILDQNPTGPYAIAGYSFGGYVAYEMAQQLTRMGKQIKMLAMFDTDAHALISHHTALERIVWKVGRQFPKFVWIGKSLWKNPAQTINYQLSFFRQRAVALLQALGLKAAPVPEPERGHLDYLEQKHEQAFQKYVLHPYAGKIDLFRAMSRPYFVDDFKYLGWREYALGGVRVHDVPGDHATMLLPPHNATFAKVLQRTLDNS